MAEEIKTEVDSNEEVRAEVGETSPIKEKRTMFGKDEFTKNEFIKAITTKTLSSPLRFCL